MSGGVRPESRRKGWLAQDLVLLGILMDGPKHGYEMRQLMETRLGQIATITAGTIYYTLRKLERRGLVRMTRRREGRRPQRHIYAITPSGKERFRELLRQSFFEEDQPFSHFDVGLYFVQHADLEDALEGARRQMDRWETFGDHVQTLARTYPSPWPFNLEAIKRHILTITEAHRAFYRELESDLEARTDRARNRNRRKVESG